MKLKHFWTALGAVCFTLSGLFAQESAHEFSIKSDNDAYLANGQDRYYTNGFFLQYRVAANQSQLKPGINKKIYELEIGQKMYTSHSGYVWERRYVDRSITAYLYAGGSITWLYESEKTLKLGVQIGTIGPAALGRQTQEIFHKITKTYAPNCWKYQLKNEMGLNFNLAFNQLLNRSASQKVDFLWNGYANLGNTFSGMGAGFTLRIGKLNQLFQSSYTRSVISKQASTTKLNETELFLFTRPQIDLVVYDASVSGGLFRKNKGPITFDSRPWVASQELGMMYSKKRFGAQISYTFKTPEIKGSKETHRYGTVSTFFRFK